MVILDQYKDCQLHPKGIPKHKSNFKENYFDLNFVWYPVASIYQTFEVDLDHLFFTLVYFMGESQNCEIVKIAGCKSIKH